MFWAKLLIFQYFTFKEVYETEIKPPNDFCRFSLNDSRVRSSPRAKIQVPDNNTSKVLTLACARMRIHICVKKRAAWNKSGKNFWQRRLQMCVLEIITSTSGGGRALFAALCRKGRRIYLYAAFVYLFIFIWLFNAARQNFLHRRLLRSVKFPPFCAQLGLLSDWNLKDQITACRAARWVKKRVRHFSFPVCIEKICVTRLIDALLYSFDTQLLWRTTISGTSQQKILLWKFTYYSEGRFPCT